MPKGAIDPAILPRLALLLPVVVLLSATSADPDLWGHVRFGGDIVAARALPQYDEYSFTSDRAWVNHEWLSEVIFYGAYRLFGPPGLVMLRLALLAAMFALVARTVRRADVPLIAGDLLLVLAAAGTLATTGTVRPQLFSLVAFAWLLSRLAINDPISQISPISPISAWRALAPAPIVFAIWANLHGGWLVGLGTLAVWTLGQVGKSSWREVRVGKWGRVGLVGMLVLCAAATAINPYGIGLWRFLADTVSVTRADIVEWRPIISAPPVELGLWIAMCALACGASMVRLAGRSRTTDSLATAAVLLLLAAGSFRVRRLDAFFALAVVMLAAPALVQFFAKRVRLRTSPVGLRRTRKPDTTDAPSAPSHPRTVFTVFLLCVGVAVCILIDGSMRPSGRFGCIDATDARLPDAQAAAFLRARLAVPGGRFTRARMLTWFDWGEYVIWHFAPNIQVSIDGRRETVYSDRVIREHLEFYFADPKIAIRDSRFGNRGADPGSRIPDPGSRLPDLLSRLNPDYAWLPANLPVIPALDAAGWQRVFNGRRSVIFLRQPSAPTPAAPPAPQSNCFPGT